MVMYVPVIYYSHDRPMYVLGHAHYLPGPTGQLNENTMLAFKTAWWSVSSELTVPYYYTCVNTPNTARVLYSAMLTFITITLAVCAPKRAIVMC